MGPKEFCVNFILPMVDWNDTHTSGLRQFDDWCSVALARSLKVTICVHDLRTKPRDHAASGTSRTKDAAEVTIIWHGQHYDLAYADVR